MGSVTRKKVLRDLWLARGRTTLLVLATSLSLTAVGAVLGAYGILAREMPLSFQSAHPASATLVLERSIDSSLLDQIRHQPGIADAELRAMVRARVAVDADRWLPLTFFVIEDFDAMRIETVEPVEGAWPPPDGTMLIDRMSLRLLETRIGAELVVATVDELQSLADAPPRSMVPHRPPAHAHTTPQFANRSRTMRVAGVVVDPGVAPAFQEQSVYAYVTPATLAARGVSAELDLLKITVSDNAFDTASIERVARRLSEWLGEQGATVEEIRIPPPGQHPHQRLMNALAIVLLLFGMLALALSGLLVATLVSAMLARQVRQIGAMKAIGALPAHIGRMYAGMVATIGGTAVVLALAPIIVSARALAGVYADFSNVVLASAAIPWWIYAVVALAGVLTPLLAAASPVIGASRMTVREAISEVAIYEAPSGVTRGAMIERAMRALGPTLTLAIRHALRRRRRLALSVVLIALGGATFMSGLNVAASSERQIAARAASPGYDLELTLDRPHPTDALLQLLRIVPEVEHVEPIGIATVAPARPGEVPIAGTHKDGGHGTQRLYALAPETAFKPNVRAGRWLEPGDLDAIVVAPGELTRLDAQLGDTVSFALDGKYTQWRIVGVVGGVGLGGHQGLYVSNAGFARAAEHVGSSNAVRIVATRHDAAGQQAALRAIERALASSGIGLSSAMESERWTTILRNHVAIVQGALGSMGVLLGLVGALTLASALSLGVVERTREFGVMQTLGATPARVVWIVVAEALFVGLSSWLVAVVLGMLLSSLIASAVGSLVFAAPLPLVVSTPAVAVWFIVAVAGSATAAALPARAASRLTIRETLVYA